MESEYVGQRASSERGLRQECRNVREQLIRLEHYCLHMCFFVGVQPPKIHRGVTKVVPEQMGAKVSLS